MRADILDKLGEAHDFCALTRTVLALCEPYGAVHAFRLTHNRGASRVACLIELESPKQQSALARALGARTLNGAVTLDIPVAREFGDLDGAAAPRAQALAIPPAARQTGNQASA
jgi:hypothetical protein